MMTIFITILLGILAALVVFYVGLKQRQIDIWIVSYIRGVFERKKSIYSGKKHVMFCFVDHYEPLAGGVDEAHAQKRVDRWHEEYPKIASKFSDADGKPPTHSFFCPEEEYRIGHMNLIEQLCRDGYGEVDIHIHHDGDTEQEFKDKINGFLDMLSERHGLVPMVDGKPRFAFIHGNWALDNARADGKWCGLNNEITILKELGCYVDYTLPSAPSDTQTQAMNEIYYATDDPDKPKSHDVGVRVEVGKPECGDLMIFQGPLTLDWKHRKLGIWPKVENGDVTPTELPFERRIDQWVEQDIHVKGRPEWVFVKVHTHGATELNADFLFGGALERMCQHLENRYNDGTDYALHYVTAREAYNIVKAAEAGEAGEPGEYRDYVIPRPFPVSS